MFLLLFTSVLTSLQFNFLVNFSHNSLKSFNLLFKNVGLFKNLVFERNKAILENSRAVNSLVVVLVLAFEVRKDTV
jgi:hypothetical protein